MRYLTVFLLTLSFFLLFPQQPALGVSCGDHVCNRPPAGSENCSTCPVDCPCTGGTVCSAGACVAPTNTPTPTPIPPTSGPTPTTNPSGPTPTPSSGGGTSTSTDTTASPAYPPSIQISHEPNNTTNTKSLFFAGIASVEKGEIASVEYSFTNGQHWFGAQGTHGKFNQPSEGFSFTTPPLPDSSYTIRIRVKSTRGFTTETSRTVRIVSTPPTVTLTTLTPNPTKDTTPLISGTAGSTYGTVASIQVSLDNGQTWLPAQGTGRFNLTTQTLEDGNYTVLARAFDNAGNVRVSQPQTLIIDTIPPIVGGSSFFFGPQSIGPDREGVVTLAARVPTTILLSMKGGVTNAKIDADNTSFRLTKQPNSDLWSGNISFNTQGTKQLTVLATDGAGNSVVRPYGSVTVEPLGEVRDKNTNAPIPHAIVSLFYFDTTFNQWVLWNGASYGQQNPQQTNGNGLYSFMIPAGKYYMEVQQPGFYTAQSNIIENTVTTTIGTSISLRAEPHISFTLPLLGKITLSLPTLTPPDAVTIEEQTEKTVAQNDLVGKKASQITLATNKATVAHLEGLGTKKMVLSFLAPWSSRSLEQAPILSAFSQNLPKNTSLQVVLLQQSVAATTVFAKRGDYQFPLFADPTGKSGDTYQVTTLPYTVFIDSKGIIKHVSTSMLSQKELEELVANMQ